jgi:hypothetical protein
VKVVNVQMVMDCADPHAQGKFWCAALGWVPERNEPFVRSVLEQGLATEDQVIEVDGVLTWRTVEAIRHPEHDAIRELGGTARLLFLQVPEGKTVKNRMHLDINVGKDHIDAKVAELVALGATELGKVAEPGAFHTTMADPEGNEFDVQ